MAPLLVWLALSASLARAQEQPAPAGPRLTLEECIALALENQPAIQALQTGVAIAGEQKRVAESYYYPHMDVTTRLTQLNKPVFTLTPSPITGQLANVLNEAGAFFSLARQVSAAVALQALHNPGLMAAAQQPSLASTLTSPFETDLLGDRFLLTNVLVTQPLYTGGKIRIQNQRAALGVEAAGTEVAKGRQHTAFEVSRAYLGILVTGELLAIIEDTLGGFRAVEKVAQTALEEGERSVTTSDVNRIRTVRQLAEGQRAQFRRDAEYAHAGLRTAMGLPTQQTVQIADTRLTPPAAVPDLPEMVQRALAQRPEVVLARIGMRNAELERKLALAQFAPDVGVFGQFTSIHDDASFLNPTNPNIWSGGLQASMPLFEGGRRLAEKRKAELKYIQVRDFLRFLEQGVTLEVEKAYLEFKATTERLTLAEAAVRDARAALKAYGDELAGGEPKDYSKYFENLVTTRLLLSGAQVEYAQNLYHSNLALAQLRLVTASHVRQPLPETGGVAPDAVPPRPDGGPGR
jgi:outer membrane protein TolC